MQGAVLRACAIPGLGAALCVAWAGAAMAQPVSAVGILTGEERAQYDASLAFCRDNANRDKIRCKRFERAYPDALPARRASKAGPETATAQE